MVEAQGCAALLEASVNIMNKNVKCWHSLSPEKVEEVPLLSILWLKRQQAAQRKHCVLYSAV